MRSNPYFMKDTWILFTPDPIDDKLGTKEEKLEAIKNFLKDSFSGYSERIEPQYYKRQFRRRNLQGDTFLLFRFNRIGGLSVLLYKETYVGLYDLIVNDTQYDKAPVTHRLEDDLSRLEIIQKYGISRQLDMTKHLSPKIVSTNLVVV
jgi:hypothetical protein